MAKSKRSGRPTPPRKLVEKTDEAYDLLERGKTTEALAILLELDQAYPNTPEVLGNLVNAYYDLKDMHNYEQAIRRLARLRPHDPDLNFALAGAYLLNERPALALHTFEEAQRRWPNHPKAGEARKEIPRLKNALQEQTASLNLSETQAFELLLQHDELRYCLSHAEYRRGRQVAERLLGSYPDFVPAINNLAQLYAVDGELDQAIQTSQRVLAIEPENIHALSNLTRLHFLSGRPVEADRYAQRLKGSRADATDRWTKIAEALTFLEDDLGILELYERAKAADELDPPDTDEIFYHLLAVAAYRLGKEKEAQKYWRKALKIHPNFDWALENLKDFQKPLEERSGVWAYPFENWLLAAAVHDLSKQLKKMKPTAEKAQVQTTLARFFEEKHPNVFFLARHLVARGDSKARTFVARIAAVTAHPVLVSAAKEFVFGRVGSLQERFEAAHILAEADLLPSGPMQMWTGGKMQEVLLLDMEISPEPEESTRPERAQELAEKAYDALHERDGQRAQELLEQALAISPDDPSLINNLAMALEMQGQVDPARRMIRELRARFPDYFFGIIAAANLEAIQGNLEQAHELLNDLMQRKKLHTSEFTALCQAQIQAYLKENNREAARSWVEVWEQVDPENPTLKMYQGRIGPVK
jgi:tetratricopeptide (TPR) repeat protein